MGAPILLSRLYRVPKCSRAFEASILEQVADDLHVCNVGASGHDGPSRLRFKHEGDLLGQDLARRSIRKALAWRSVEAVYQLLELASRYLCDVRVGG